MAFQRVKSKLRVVPHGHIRMTEFARAMKCPWIFLGNGWALDARKGLIRLNVAAGGPKPTFFEGRWMVGFGATAGSGTTDRLNGLSISGAKSKWRSLFWQYYLYGYGGGNLGRFFQEVGGTGLEKESLYIGNNTGYRVFYNRQQISTGVGQWGITHVQSALPTLNAHKTMSITQDQTTYGIVPLWWEDATVQPNTSNQNSNTDYSDINDVALEFGNRSSDSARGFDGYMGIIAPFDADIGPRAQIELHQNPVGMLIEKEPIFVPMFSSAPTGRFRGAVNLDGLGSGGQFFGDRVQ